MGVGVEDGGGGGGWHLLGGPARLSTGVPQHHLTTLVPGALAPPPPPPPPPPMPIHAMQLLWQPVPDELLEQVVARKVDSLTGERMKFFEKVLSVRQCNQVRQRAAGSAVWWAMAEAGRAGEGGRWKSRRRRCCCAAVADGHC